MESREKEHPSLAPPFIGEEGEGCGGRPCSKDVLAQTNRVTPGRSNTNFLHPKDDGGENDDSDGGRKTGALGKVGGGRFCAARTEDEYLPTEVKECRTRAIPFASPR